MFMHPKRKHKGKKVEMYRVIKCNKIEKLKITFDYNNLYNR